MYLAGCVVLDDELDFTRHGHFGTLRATHEARLQLVELYLEVRGKLRQQVDVTAGGSDLEGLDALVLRAAFARTTAQARQMVVHRHILVDGKIVDRPSFRVKPGQLIHVKARSEGTEPFQVAAAGGHVDVLPKTPAYLEVELDKLQARLVRRPKRAEVPVTAEVQLVVEYYAAR